MVLDEHERGVVVEAIIERFEDRADQPSPRRGYRASSSFDHAVGVDEKPVTGLQGRRADWQTAVIVTPLSRRFDPFRRQLVGQMMGHVW